MGALSEQHKASIGQALIEGRVACWCRSPHESRDIQLIPFPGDSRPSPIPSNDQILGIVIYAVGNEKTVETAIWDQEVVDVNPEKVQLDKDAGINVLSVDRSEIQWGSLYAIQQAYFGLV